MGKAVNPLLTFVTCIMFFPYFFHVILALEEAIAEVTSFGIPRSFFNYISVPFKHLMKNFVDQKSFLNEILFMHVFLVMHRS